MKDSTYQHVCTVLVGVATLFRFTGYDMATFIVESLVHSAHVRDPTSIIDHAGYYGQCLKEISSCLATFIVPIILNYMKPKWALVIGCGIFAFYIASFFYLNNYLYFFANIVLGIGFTLNYTAFNTYQMQFSTRKTLARNSARVWGIASLSLFCCGVLYIYITSTHSSIAEGATGDEEYRYYSQEETRTISVFLFISCLIALVLNIFFPSREVANSVASENPHVKLTLKQQISAMASVLVNPYILMFIPRFLNHGLFFAFYMNVYPTSLQFSTILAKKYPMLTAYYSFAMCAGTAVTMWILSYSRTHSLSSFAIPFPPSCGLLIAPLNRRFHDFGLRPLYYITIVIQLLTYLVAVLTVPNWSTARPTAEGAILEPSVVWLCVVAFLLGFGDTANTSSNSVICSRLIPGRASHTYSVARFYMGVTAAIIFFCSPLLTMRAHAIIMTSATILSGLTFDFAVRRVEKREEETRNEKTPVEA